MVSVVKRIKLLLDIFFLLFVIETHYCSAASLPVGEMIHTKNRQAQEVDVRGSVIVGYLRCEGIANILYWFFDLYQKEPGLYWYKHYCSFGYRTCLLSNRFYFDFYMRTWINILFALNVWVYYREMKSVSRSPGYAADISKQKEYDSLSNKIKMCLCFMFVPAVDLNICFGDNFYLVIGFRDIIIMYFAVKASILDKKKKNIKKIKLAEQIEVI